MLRTLIICLVVLVAATSCQNTAVADTAPAFDSIERPGFVVSEQDGRLWVFRSGSDALAEFQQHGEPGKCTTLIGAGPDGMTLKGADRATLDEYLAQRPGFFAKIDDGRLWVFREGSEELAEFQQHGEPAKCTTLIGKGPGGMTIKGPDRPTIDAYLGG